MAHEVFFCHSSIDLDAADALRAGLEAAGLRCWIAPRDITPGKSWAAAIADGVETSQVVLVLFSAASNASAQVHHEVHLADSKGLPLLLVRLEDLAPSGGLKYYLGDKHWFDAFPPPVESHLTQLAEHIKKLLADFPRKATSATSAKPSALPTEAVVPPMPTVLVVDDDEEVRLQVKSELAKDGFQAILAEDGGQALAKLREMPKPPGLIILDMMMPVLDGIEFLHRFRGDPRAAKVPVIVLTSQSGGGWKAATSGLGADAFLSKPLLPKELRACVRGFLQPGRP